MPLLLVIPYVLLECLAFWGVSSLIGTGWALALLLAFFFGGLLLVRFELNKVARKAERGQSGPGSTMGDLGLILAGCVLLVLPGFITGILGLLLVISPTRNTIRKLLARRVRTMIEDIGIRTFQATGRFEPTQYGDFRAHPSTMSGHSSHPSKYSEDPEVLDEEEIHRWSENLTPEDFTQANSSSSDKNKENEDKDKE